MSGPRSGDKAGGLARVDLGTMRHKDVPQLWAIAIDDFVQYLQSSGAPATTQRARREQLQHLARRVGPDPWAVTADELVAYFAAHSSWKPETRRSRRAACRLFWRWAKQHGRVRKNIAKALPPMKPGKPNPQPTPEPVYEAALRRADDRTRLILRLAHDAGLRRGEIAVAHSRDLVQDLIGWSLIVHGKGAKTRVVPLTPRLAFDLRALGDGYFFPGAIEGHLSPRRVSELAGAVLPEPWTIHKLRHRFATDLKAAVGGDVQLVQQACGWESADTANHYIPVTIDQLRAGIYAARGVKAALTADGAALEAV